MVLATAGARRAKHARSASARAGSHNVASVERVGSAVVGAALVAYGLRRRDGVGVLTAILGGAFFTRGASGHCPVYDALGVSTGDSEPVLDAPQHRGVTGRAATVNARRAIKLERSVTIERPRAELYAYWREFTNLPRFMEHLVSVRVESPERSHWVAKAPSGRTVEWDAEIVNDVPDSIIAWKTVGEPDIANAGAVNFSDAPGDRGTIVRVTLDYEPPGGRVGALLAPFARLFGEEPDRQVREDLRKFKQLMETGAVTTSARRLADSAYAGAADFPETRA